MTARASSPGPQDPGLGDGPGDGALVRSMLESTPDGLLVAGPDGLVSYVNRRLEELSGYARGDLIGKPVEVLVPAASAEHHRQLHDEFRRSPRSRLMGQGRGDLSLLRADGTHIPVEIGLSAVRVGRGRTMTVASIRDVREQRAADRRRQRLLALLDLLPEAVLVFDRNFEVLYGNAAAALWHGSTPEELVGMTAWDFDASLPKVTPEELDALLRPAPGRPSVRRMMLRTKDGGGIPCESRAQLSLDPELGPRRVVLLHDLRPQLVVESVRARRSALSELAAAVTAEVLGGADPDIVYARVVAGARRILDTDNSAVIVLTPGTGEASLRAVAGAITDRLPRSVLPFIGDVPAFLAEHPRGAVLAGPPESAHPLVHEVVGPMAAAPLGEVGTARGILAMARWRGREPFTPDDLDLLRLLALQAALAVELGEERIDRERLDLLEDRQRIGRELHDGVVQDLIGVGMALSRSSGRIKDDGVRAEVMTLVGQLDQTVQRLRHAVFDLRPQAGGLPATLALAGLVAEASRALGFEPDLEMHGPLDDVPNHIVDELAATAREALSNVGRHAHASAARVRVDVARGTLTLVVEDNGSGLRRTRSPGYGLGNISHRAELLGGKADFSTGPMGGARIRWRVPVSAAVARARRVRGSRANGE